MLREHVGGDVLERRVSEGDDLPEEDSEGPDVGLVRVLSLEDCLRGHPLEGDAAGGVFAIVVGVLQIPAKTKEITDVRKKDEIMANFGEQ